MRWGTKDIYDSISHIFSFETPNALIGCSSSLRVIIMKFKSKSRFYQSWRYTQLSATHKASREGELSQYSL